MHFGEAIGLLLVVTVAAIVLRAFWHKMPRRYEKTIFLVGAAVVVIRLIFVTTLWTTIFPHLNAVICWLSVIAYELILVRFSLMRPRWLTSICAIILLVPMFGSTLLFPLTGLFDTDPQDLRPIAKNYDLERMPWDPKISGKVGYDYGLLYRPSWLPFMHHLAQRSAFSEEQCQAANITVNIDRERRLVHFHCPGHQGKESDINHVLPMR